MKSTEDRSPPAARLGDAPLYKEVRKAILQCLSRGEWAAGERIPPEPALATRFGVAVPTVRAGIADLVGAGILVRHQGSGTFVARHGSARQLVRYSNIQNSRHEKVVTRREALTMKKARSDRETARLLHLPPGDHALYRIEALLMVESARVALMHVLLPLALFTKLTKQAIEKTPRNLYSVYQEVCGVTVVRMEERIHARAADPATAAALGVKARHPVLLVERIAYTYDERPVELRRRWFEGSEHHYLFRHGELD